MVGYSPKAGVDDHRAPADESLDAVYALLTHRRRRYILAFLADHSGPFALADLAREAASREYDSPISEIPEEDVEEVYISLYHTHLPKLEEAGIVEYDRDANMVRELDTADHLHRVRAFAADGGTKQ